MTIDANALDAACTPGIDRELLMRLISAVNEAYSRQKNEPHSSERAPFPLIWSNALLEAGAIDLLSFQNYKQALATYYNTKRKDASPKAEPFKMAVEECTWFEARVRVSENISILFRSLREKGTLKNKDVAYKHHVLHGPRDVSTTEVMAKATRTARIAINGVRTGRTPRMVLSAART